MYVLTNRGRNRPRKTTVVWKLLVQWEDKSESWTPLKYMKESHTVKVSEFSKERGIYDEPVFEWWFTYNPRKRDVIIYEVKHCIIKKTHKYSIKLSTTVEKAIEIDKIMETISGGNLLKRRCCRLALFLKYFMKAIRTLHAWKKLRDT